MATYERGFDDMQIHLTVDDRQTLEARDIDLGTLAEATANRAAGFCRTKDTVVSEDDGVCGIRSVVTDDVDAAKVRFICEQQSCSDRTLFVDFATQTLMKRINTETQFRRQFRH